MKKVVLMTVCASLMLASCGTYTGAGAFAGSELGSVLGSAIGGLSDGPRGSDVGTIIGMAGGAVLGGIIGNQADQQNRTETQQYQQNNTGLTQQQNESYNNTTSGTVNNSGFDESNSGDDRIYDFNGSDYNGSYSAQQPTITTPKESSVDEIAQQYAYTPNLEIRNARFVDSNQDGVLNAGEVCKLIFEVFNRGEKEVSDVVPTVIETTGNRHVWVSQSIHVEKIAPGKGIRYTAVVMADKKIKEGKVQFCASVVQDNKAISKVCEFNIQTAK